MKPNEMRLDNLVGFGDKVCKVIEITQIAFYVRDELGEQYKSTWADLKPIPITEDWLLKIGFIDNPKHEHPSFNEYVLDGEFGIGDFNGQYWIVEDLDQSLGSPELKYVHQLQNLYFSITGLELVK